jgi:hypothetical protein
MYFSRDFNSGGRKKRQRPFLWQRDAWYAFDDGALALIAIRRTGIAPNERGRFLRELAAKLDPPTSR